MEDAREQRDNVGPMDFEYLDSQSRMGLLLTASNSRSTMLDTQIANTSTGIHNLSTSGGSTSISGNAAIPRSSSPIQDEISEVNVRPYNGKTRTGTAESDSPSDSEAEVKPIRRPSSSSIKRRVSSRRSRSSSPYSPRTARANRPRKRRGFPWFQNLIRHEEGSSTKGAIRLIKLAFHLSLFLLFVYILYACLETIRTDVQRKVEEQTLAILNEIEACRKEYINNRCHSDDLVPLQKGPCLEWEKCINRDPSDFGRARLAAEAFAEIIEAFMRPLSMRTVFTFVASAFGAMAFLNIMYTLYINYNNHTGSSSTSSSDASYIKHGGPMGLPYRNLRVQEIWHETIEETETIDPDDTDSDSDVEERRGRQSRRRSTRHRNRSRSRSQTRVRVRYKLEPSH